MSKPKMRKSELLRRARQPRPSYLTDPAGYLRWWKARKRLGMATKGQHPQHRQKRNEKEKGSPCTPLKRKSKEKTVTV